jgi:hypothetical protein
VGATTGLDDVEGEKCLPISGLKHEASALQPQESGLGSLPAMYRPLFVVPNCEF